MKRKSKGFMLIEVVITSTVVLVAMVTLYNGINKLYSNYKVRNSYNNLDGVYATKDFVISMMKNNNNFNKLIDSYSSDYKYFIENNSCVDDLEGLSYNCNVIKEKYKIKNMIFVSYDKKILEDLTSKVTNQTFKDYITYLTKYYDFNATKDQYSYIILTEMNADEIEENYYYSNLRMR